MKRQHEAQVRAVAEAIDAVDVLDLSDCNLIMNSWLTEAERTNSTSCPLDTLLIICSSPAAKKQKLTILCVL